MFQLEILVSTSKAPPKGFEQLVELLENNAIPEIGEAESEALAAFLNRVINI